MKIQKKIGKLHISFKFAKHGLSQQQFENVACFTDIFESGCYKNIYLCLNHGAKE